MKTFEDTQQSQTAASLPIVHPNLWQWMVEFFHRRRPMVADLRAEELYRAQKQLIADERELDHAQFTLACAKCRYDQQLARIHRLSGGTLGGSTEGDPRKLFEAFRANAGKG